jgi:hypothetical protein
MLMRLRGLLLGLVGVLVLCLPGVAVAAEGQGCPNEALRDELGDGFLPDCRAYEMVSPVYKEGYPFLMDSFSSDGERAFMASFGAAAGIASEGQGLGEGAVYMDSRTAEGWQLEPVIAPLSRFVGQDPVAYEADSGLSLWEQHLPSQSQTTQDLYLRSVAGVYSEVGPLATPENSKGEPSNVIEAFQDDIGLPIAGTSDFSHVLLQVSKSTARWPFDHTSAGYSLYEYSGTGNSAPILVDVTGPEKGSSQLVGACGAQLGSGEGWSMYNALSGDGETVFFTPGTEGQCGTLGVWARRHGSLHSSLPAETVDVSARAPEPACTGACRSSAESGKNFEGASEDGGRVFFTSTQQLLNGASQDPVASDDAAPPGSRSSGLSACAATTGAGGCNLYEYDFNAQAGGNLRLVAGGAEVLGVARVAQNGSRVYFVAKGERTKTANEFGATPVAGQPNLYVYDTQEAERNPAYEPVFIATLSPNDSEDWQRRDDRPVWATADGRFVVFASSQLGLTPGDTATGTQLFEYDAQTGELVRITQGEDGYGDNGNDATTVVSGGGGIEPEKFESEDFHSSGTRWSRPIAGNGMTVVFESAGRLSPLAPAAEQGCTSVYEYRSDGSIADGGVHLISDGVDTQITFEGGRCGAIFVGMNHNGENILFSTDDPLLASDTNGVQRDIYDARVDGGFAAPSVPAACQGEGCLRAPAAPLAVVGAGSGAASGAASGGGNFPPMAPSAGVVKPTVRSLTRAQRLARALKACRQRPRRKRQSCEAQARKRYDVVSKASGRGVR